MERGNILGRSLALPTYRRLLHILHHIRMHDHVAVASLGGRTTLVPRI
jgi:hypothetical protein